MAATIYTPPPDLAFSQDDTYTWLATDQIVPANAAIVITISASPAVGETLKIIWPGGEILFTVTAEPTLTGTDWPAQEGGETIEEYTARIAEFFRQSAVLRDVFTVGFGATIALVHPVAEIFEVEVENELSGVSAVAFPATEAPTPPNLVAYLEVWAETGNFDTETLLLAQHSPYDSDGFTWFNLTAAFSHLKPFLPNPATINPDTPAFSSQVATSHLQRYYLRFADKFGTPPKPGALIRTPDSYIAILGGRAGDAYRNDFPPLRHNYYRRDHLTFIKPVDEAQPDWVYFMVPENAAADIKIVIRWSDGTSSNYLPFGTADTGWEAGKIYVVPSGFMQMNLHTRTPSGGTDTDATIIGYDWVLDSDAEWTITVRHEVRCDTPWEHYLLFENGMGGMETVALRGKFMENYGVTGETYSKPRQPGWTPAKGDFEVFAREGQPGWDFSTGWYADDYYLDHLRQLPLAKCWLIDVRNRRFLKVIVEAQTLEDVKKDDVTLYALPLKVKAGWKDKSANV